ncbi:MAG: IPT/TIG domain-containing protein [Candidatus Nomurabacteria bacterium]|nr:IPT/TIG domain-containing protein [Candidatus Nomurabacteria bacterium]
MNKTPLSGAGTPSVSLNVYLGALNANNGATASNPFHGKIYGFKYWKSGSLTRDMIPVCNTVTGKGGMLDRVSGVFYGSASGTDFADCGGKPVVTFDAGGSPVVCSNVTVVNDTTLTCVIPAGTPTHAAGTVNVDLSVAGIAAVSTLTNGYTFREPMTITSVSPGSGPVSGGTNLTITGNNFMPPSASNYAQNGLVLNYDAIENTGYGTHSATATTWTDLSPSGNNMTISGSTWTNNSLILNGAKTSNSDVPILANGEATVEVVLKRSAMANTTIGGNGAGATPNKAFQLKLRASGNAYYHCLVDNTGNVSGLAQPLNTLNIYSFTTGHSDSSHTNCTAYRSGSQVGAGSFASGIGYDFGKFTFTEGITAAMELNIYSVRVYNRVLSAGEIAQNAALDAQRFVPTTVTLDIGGTPAVCENVVVVSNTQITCTTSAHAQGLVSVTVDNGYDSATQAGARESSGAHAVTGGFLYLAAPAISITGPAVTTNYVAANSAPWRLGAEQ